MFCHLVFITVLLRLMQCMETAEPKCYSRYDWQDKLLEKSIRTELAMQQYVQSMETALGEIRAYKDEFNSMKATLKETVEEMKANVNNTVEELKASVESQMSQVETVTKLKEKLQTPTVMFSSKNVADYSPSRQQVMVFTSVMQNIGNGYDSSTGIFTAPVNGTYMFNVQLCVHSNNWAQFQLAVDSSSDIIAAFGHYNSDGGDLFTTTTVYPLSVGQQIWVQSYRNSGSTNVLFDSGTDCWCQFSGSLVHH